MEQEGENLIASTSKKLVYSISRLEEYENNFPKPINIAHYLSRGFDCIRVHLYILGDQICFGKYTPYHAAGIAKVTSEQRDDLFGKHWHCKEISFEPSGGIRKIID